MNNYRIFFSLIFLSWVLKFDFAGPGASSVTSSATSSNASFVASSVASSGPPPGLLRSPAFHVKRKWISPNTTPATYNAAASRTTKVCPNQTQARYPVPWLPRLPTKNDGGCEIVPHLSRETRVDVRLCQACHAQCRGVTRYTPTT